jgi:hypothetical protein
MPKGIERAEVRGYARQLSAPSSHIPNKSLSVLNKSLSVLAKPSNRFTEDNDRHENLDISSLSRI